MNRLATLFLGFFLLSVICLAQQKEYLAFLIPNDLKEDANAVVRNSATEITIEDVDQMIVSKTLVVTVLNKLGNVDARIGQYYDNDTKITKLSASIYNAFGKEIKKYKSRDFEDISAVDGGTLYSDSKVKKVNYTPTNYPYTLVFESEYKTSTTGFIPTWFPVNGYFVSVENSSYTIHNPNLISWRKKESNFEGFTISKKEDSAQIKYVLKNQKAFDYESSSLSSRNFLPMAKVALNQFNLKGVQGSYKNWNEFGKWMHNKLLKDRDFISETTKTKILNLVKGVENPLEKAKIVYQYMQNKTRYISVQVGIGGWEPVAANQVDQVGYGDCKGLTNYTKALLDIVGVTAYYTVVYADEQRNIDADFSSLQGNHVILNLPYNGKDFWLECTSKSLPFGFLGDFTDDRDVLVVTPSGGIIKRTASYKNEDNLQISKATIKLLETGDVHATLLRTSTGIQYDDKYFYKNLSEQELIKNYKTAVWSYNNNLEINDFNLINDKDSVVFKENLDITIKNFASISESEYLFRVNIFNVNSFVPKRYRNRKRPLKVSRGYKDVDEFTITIPENYKLVYLPEPTKISTKFGNYTVVFEQIDKKTFVYKKLVLIKEGLYPKEDYKLFRSFCKQITKLDNQRISISKK